MGDLEGIPCDTKGQLRFLGTQKLLADFQLSGEVSASKPHIVQGQLYTNICKVSNTGLNLKWFVLHKY